MSRNLIAPLLIGCVGAAILIWLGMWQVQRLAWKEAILADIAARVSAAPVDVPAEPDFETDRYLPVKIEGELEGAVRILISLKREGPGYRIVSRIRTDERILLVDRGFAKDFPAQGNKVQGYAQVVGNLHWPDDNNSSTPMPDVDGNIWFARDLEALAAHFEAEPILVVARSIAPDDGVIMPLPLDGVDIPNDHLNYAITWFSLALIWVGMTLFLVWRIKRRTF